MDSEFAYLGTIGRKSGQWHVVEIWYGERDGVVYLMSGGGDRADWVRNLRANPRVRIRLGDPRALHLDGAVEATAATVTDPAEEAMARRLMANKYQGWQPGGELSEWARTALVLAVHPDAPAGSPQDRDGRSERQA